MRIATAAIGWPALLLVAIIAAPLLVVTGCSEDSEAPAPDDTDSWTVVTETTLHHPDPGGRFQAPRWSPDGKHLAISGSGGLFLTSFPSRSLPSPIIGPQIYDFAWSPDSRHVAAILSQGASVIIYDVRTGRISGRINVYAPTLADLVWTTGGYVAVSAPYSGTHFYFDVDGNEIPEYRIADPSCAWQRSHFGQALEIWVIDRQDRQERLIAGPGRWFRITSQYPRARLLVAYTDVVEKDIVISQLLDYTGLYRYAFPEGFIDSEWSSDGRYVVGTEITGYHHDAVTATEIVVFNSDTYQYSTITDTPDVIESNPSLCVANDRIAYSDDEGRVVIGRVVAVDGDAGTGTGPSSPLEPVHPTGDTPTETPRSPRHPAAVPVAHR